LRIQISSHSASASINQSAKRVNNRGLSGKKSSKKGKKSGGSNQQIHPNPCGCEEDQFFDYLDWGVSGCDEGECFDCDEVRTLFDEYLEPAPFICDFFEIEVEGNTTVLPFGGREDCKEKCFYAYEDTDSNGCDPHTEFFNYDDFEFLLNFPGTCESCENYSHAQECATDGLPRGGEVECLNRCFGIF
jgi:hypothetical protein